MEAIKLAELRRAKRLPLWLLAGAALLFIATVLWPLYAPPSLWTGGLKAISEAAMVGALADWFAVSALFRHVPIPLAGRHTAIIARNKDRIADNLARFVEDKFLDPDSLLALIRRHDPAQSVARWLSNQDNAARLSGYLLQMMQGMLDLADDRHIQQFMRRAIHQAIDKVDLTRSAALILESLTKDNRHQALLDDLLARVMKLINRPATHQLIASQVVSWLKRDHPLKEKVLPGDWLGDKSAQLAANAARSILNDIENDPDHALRHGFNRAVQRLIDRLHHEPEMAQKAEEIKIWLKQDPALNGCIGELWGDLRDWLKQDLQREDSRLHAQVSAAGLWLGSTLMQDRALRASLNQHLEQAVQSASPAFSAFLSRHISDTVKSWDAQSMSQQVELNIGRDLQHIRVNGTLVGGLIGLMLYLLSLLPLLL